MALTAVLIKCMQSIIFSKEDFKYKYPIKCQSETWKLTPTFKSISILWAAAGAAAVFKGTALKAHSLTPGERWLIY